MIVRDEAAIIERCLASFWEHVDQVAVLDTGSTDGTLDVVRAYKAQRAAGEPMELGGPALVTDTFEWVDDFAAARNAADALLTTDWKVWVDADDIILGAQNLRPLAAQAPLELAAYGCGYDYARDEAGACVCYLKRERLVRAGHSRWANRVHEAQLIEGGGIEWLPANVLEYRHEPSEQHGHASSERNRRILHAWIADEPENPRVLSYLGTELAALGEHNEALDWFAKYLAVESSWPEERAQIHRKMAGCLLDQGRVDEAIDLALAALRVHPEWPDSYLTLAEGHYRRGEWEHAESWCRRVLELGEPDTLLIVNPLDYTFLPRLVLAGALGEQGRVDDAIRVGEEAAALCPDPRILNALDTWRPQRKRTLTASRVIELAQSLVAHDEQLKALQVLESAPYFVQDHPGVVAARSELRQRLLFLTDSAAYSEHYEVGGSKPEDFLADKDAFAIAEQLPRARFLLEGLAEQVAA
jgi:tetratricopeptide (TPR) repeat protein